MTPNSNLSEAHRWVVKIGSSLLTDDGRGINRPRIEDWARQISTLIQTGKEVVLVSSGAVAEGRARMDLKQRPATLPLLQATAAIGQMGLVQAWETAFSRQSVKTAQILFTHDDIANRRRYLNAQGTLKALLEWAVVPVVNENDTVATDEIRLGDNDTLAALTCNLVEGDVLVILTDQHGVFSADPSKDANAQLIPELDVHDELLDKVAGGSRSDLGRGGMQTKITAARWAARSGAMTIIASGAETDVLIRLANNEAVGTRLTNTNSGWQARKLWIAGHVQAEGSVTLDSGAVKALTKEGTSLLPVGVISVSGNFAAGELIACMDKSGKQVASGLSNYSSRDAKKLCGVSSDQISNVLGYSGDAELVHRDNLILI